MIEIRKVRVKISIKVLRQTRTFQLWKLRELNFQVFFIGFQFGVLDSYRNIIYLHRLQLFFSCCQQLFGFTIKMFFKSLQTVPPFSSYFFNKNPSKTLFILWRASAKDQKHNKRKIYVGRGKELFGKRRSTVWHVKKFRREQWKMVCIVCDFHHSSLKWPLDRYEQSWISLSFRAIQTARHHRNKKNLKVHL